MVPTAPTTKLLPLIPLAPTEPPVKRAKANTELAVVPTSSTLSTPKRNFGEKAWRRQIPKPSNKKEATTDPRFSNAQELRKQQFQHHNKGKSDDGNGGISDALSDE